MATSPKTLQNQPRTNAHFNDSWTLSQSATSEKPFPAKTEDKRESLNTKAASTKPQTLAETGVILRSILASLKKSMRVLNMWLMVVQVAIAHIAVNVGYQILILLI